MQTVGASAVVSQLAAYVNMQGAWQHSQVYTSDCLTFALPVLVLGTPPQCTGTKLAALPSPYSLWLYP